MSWWRRCAVFTAIVFGLSVAVPPGAVPNGGSFPLGWLTDQFVLARAWAAVTGLPVQQRRDPGRGGYVPASETTANGGSGRVPAKVAGGLDGYLPHDPSTARAITDPDQRGYVSSTSKRQAGASTASMNQFANADGSVTRIHTAGRTNYRAADGSWQAIDPVLVRSGQRWRMRANSLNVSLANTPAAPVQAGAVTPSPSVPASPAPTATPTGATATLTAPAATPTATVKSDPLVSMTLPSGQTVAYDLDGAAVVTPRIDGTTAVYPEILPGTALELQTFTDGVKETLILDSPAAGNEWVFPLRLTGLTPRQTAEGSIELLDAAGKARAFFPTGSMTDSKFDPRSGDMTRSGAVAMSLTTLNGAPALRVVADRTWLNDPARVYPVRVDPTVTTGATGDVYVDNDKDTSSSDQNGDNLPVGTYDAGTTKARSYIHFDEFDDDGLTGKRITGASLKLYLTWQYSCTVDRPFHVHTAAQSWTVANLSTAAYPGASISADPIGSLTVTDPGSACTNTGANRSVGKWVTVPLNVATFNDWSSGGSNLGLALVSSVTDSNAWKRFTAANYSSGAYKPQLSLTYTANVTPQVDTRYPANNQIVETLTPQLVSRAHDPDAYPAKGLTYTYTVYDTAGTAVVSSGALTTPAWQVPAGKLAWNSTYLYTIKVGDKVGTSAESVAYAFATTVPQPRLTSDLTQNQGVGYDPNNGNYTTSASDVQIPGVGPELAISRNYNSLDTRRDGAFGQGWSSILDTRATERAETVVITYPTGAEVAFGRNADGTFTPPSGRYAILTKTAAGYTLTDKDATQYVFHRTRSGSGVYRITQIIDANGRALTFGYDGASDLISTMTSAAGRKLTLTWATAASQTVGAAHVASVTTDAPAAGGAGYTWTYTYGTYDRLTSVCPPGTTTACTVYNWANWNNQYANAALDLNPYSYWRLNDASGPSAVSSVLTNAGVDNGTYKDVALGGSPSLVDSGATTAGFNGTSSYVQLPGKLVNDGSYQSLSMWFKTSTPNGVLFSYSGSPITNGTTTSNYTPALYVDKSGYLRGQFWQGGVNPMKSLATVTDGNWHHVVIAGAGGTQTMYVDGVQNATLAGTIGLYQISGAAHEYIGAGFIGGGWPDHADTGNTTAPARFFNGSISDVAFYTKTLTKAEVENAHWVARNSNSAIRYIKSPAGRYQSQVAVSNVTGQVTSVTDADGGVWTMGTPAIAGSSDVYVASVLGGKPLNYWRLGELDRDTTDAVNEVAGDVATYSTVTVGDTGPFADSTAGLFNGATSSVALPPTVARSGASSAGVWFKTTATGQVILGSQAGALGETTAPGLPSLWISADGRLRGLAPSATPSGPLRNGMANMCADVSNGTVPDGTKIQIWGCNNTLPQNWTLNADGSVRAYGKCLDIKSSGTANGTLVQLYTCNSSVAQVWEQHNGGLRNPNSGKCLDNPNGSTTNGTQLQLYTCNGSAPQKWTMSLVSTAAVNDGKWHSAVLASNGTTQTLYVDGVKATSSPSSVAFNPGPQPFAYLGAGHTGSGWSGLTANTTSYFAGSLAEAAFYSAELTEDQVGAQFAAGKQAVPVAVTTVDTTVKNITMPVKTVTVTDPGGKTISYAYDLINNRPVAETDALGNVTRYGYDTGGFGSLVYDPNGTRTQTVQDQRGNTIQQITCQDQSANKCSSTFFEYFLNAASVVDPRNDVMTASLDGRSTDKSDTRYRTTYGYDVKGNPVGSTDPLGRTTSTTYSDGTTVAAADSGFAPPGLPVKVVNAAGGVQVVRYFATGDLAETVTPAGEITRYTYDKLGRKLTETVVTSTFPAGLTTSYTYDAEGRVLTQTDPPVTNRVTSVKHTLQATNVYDADGNMTSQTIADLTGGDVTRTQTVTYNTFGQRESITDAVGKKTSFTYNAYGQVVTETDADGGVTEFVTDAEDNVLSETMKGWTGDPNNPSAPVDLVTETNKYDPAGRLASTTDAMGRTTAYEYTDNGLTATVTVTDGARGYVQERNEYDGDGNLTVQLTANGTSRTEFQYDNAGRQIKTILDPAGENRVLTNELSADDNIVSTSQSKGAGSALEITDFAYDTEGRILSETEFNGDPATTPVGRWKLNETSGTTVADTAGNSRGTATDMTWSTSAPSGRTGSAAFTGANTSRIATAGPVLDTARSYTVSAWVYLTGRSGNRAAVSQDGPVRSAFLLGYGSGNDRWRMLVSKSSTESYTVDSTAAPALNTWTHLSAVYDATAKTVTLYVNGVAQGSTATTSMPATGPFVIGGGKWGGNADAWPGQIADVQAYQRALTAGQVSGIYGGTVPSTGTIARTASVTDESGLVTRSINELGDITDVVYDEAERPVVSTGPAITAETIDKNLVVKTVTARPVTYVGYDTFGGQTETVDANGNRTVNVYDRAGRVYETRGAEYETPGGVKITPVTKAEYDTLGQTRTSTDTLGNITSYTYDQLGNLAKTVAPDGGVSTAVYDRSGLPLTVTDPTGAVSATTYDFMGRRETTTQAVRQTGKTHTTRYTYETSGRLASVKSPDGVTQSMTYNNLGEPLTSTDGANQVTRTEYDGLGRSVKVTNPDGSYQTAAYDMLSRLAASAAYPAGGGAYLTRTTQTYDAAGRVLKSTDGRGHVTSYTYDASGMLISEQQPTDVGKAITTTFGYDLNGNRTRFTDGRKNAFWTTYNAWGLPESAIEPATAAYSANADRTYTTTYDAAGRTVSSRLPGGVTQTFAYDSMGRLKEQAGTGAEAATATRKFGYDLAGRVTSFATTATANTVTYDDRGLATAITGPSGDSSYEYTGDGQLAKRTDAAGVTSFGYDTAGRMKTLVNTAAGTDLTYEYNENSAVKKITYGQTGNTRNFAYDGLSRLLSDELKTPAGTSIAKIGYTWDANSNETSKTTTNFGTNTTITNTYEYDHADRLTSWNNGTTKIGYTYDESGNRTSNGSTTYTYDARNRLVSDTTGVTYTYSARGTLGTVASSAGVQTTTADAFDQTSRQSFGTGGSSRTYEYDALGRALLAGHSYTGTGNDLAADSTATYVRDPGMDVVGTVAGGVGRLVWTDLHDDVVGQFTATGTALTGSTVYDPLGAVKTSTGMLGSLGYQSEWTDTSTGRVNMAARWYNTGTGQFDSRDTWSNSPVPDSINANRYQYGDGNPMTVTDPSGHKGFWSSVGSGISSAWNKGVSKVQSVSRSVSSYSSQAWSYARSYASYAYSAGAKHYYKAKAKVYGAVSRVAKHYGYKKVAKWADKGRKKATKKQNYHQRKQNVKKKEVERKGHALKKRTVRAVVKTYNKVKDAHKKAVKFVAKHKKTIITAVAVVATVVAVATLGPVGGILAGIAINVAKDAMLGEIHSVGDLGKSLLTGAISGTIGALTGGLGAAIGGKAAGFVACKLGAGLLGRASAGAAGGGVSGGVSDAAEQFATTGRVNWSQTAQAAATGAAIGAVTGGAARCHSFDPATPVLMANGTTKAISDVDLGDEVLATDPETGETTGKPVSVKHHHQDTDLTDVTVTDTETGESSTLKTTANHPFWNAEKKEWTEAADLKEGDKLRSADGETTQTVTAIKVWTGLKWMDDLTVDDLHTYYVLAGSEPVLVHNNAACDVPAPSKSPRAIGPVEASGKQPYTLPRLVFKASRMPNIVAGIRKAFAAGKPMVLNRTTVEADIDANRAAATRGFTGAPLSPDEYPVASSRQGGAGAHITAVPLIEQRRQGGTMSAFYRKNRIGHDDPFEVDLQ